MSSPVQAELVETGSLQHAVEAVLFVASEALSIDRLAKLTGAPHVEVTEALARIGEDFAQRGIVLREVAGGYRFASAPSARAVVEAYLLPPKTHLSPAAMETLSIVAHLQPVTKSEIEALRGVNVDGVTATLLDRGLIAESGRKDVVGRPMLYKTTPLFLESFGLRSLSELPPVDLEAEPPPELPLVLTDRMAAARDERSTTDESDGMAETPLVEGDEPSNST
jgi:segregation and condensation protein B